MKTKITFKLHHLIAAILLVTISACHKDQRAFPTPAGKYQDGFFMINEGSYGQLDGSVSFFNYITNTLTDSVFTKENTGSNIDPNTASLEFGTIYNNKLYLLTKSGGPLVVTDALSLKETNRIAANTNNDWRALIGLSATSGLVSTGNGLFPINLSTLALGTQISSVSGEIGDMVKAGNYIFVLSANDGLDILKASDYSLEKNIPDMTVGFAVTPDGSVWVAGDTNLDQINPSTLTVTTVTLPFTVNSTWGAWHAGSITASTKNNSVYIANNPPYEGGTSIYKYTEGSASSVSSAFINIASGKEMYGKGLAYNPITNQLVVNTVQSGYGTNYAVNDLDFYDPTSGSLIKDVPFTGYFFPATFVFH